MEKLVNIAAHVILALIIFCVLLYGSATIKIVAIILSVLYIVFYSFCVEAMEHYQARITAANKLLADLDLATNPQTHKPERAESSTTKHYLP